MYVPGVLADGVMSPVVALIVKPAVDEYVPPAVPVKLTACGVLTEEQNGPAYVMVADDAAFIVTVAVALALHPPDVNVYVTV